MKIVSNFPYDFGMPSELGIAYTLGLGRQPRQKYISKVTGF
jgi:hypothetical protein